MLHSLTNVGKRKILDSSRRGWKPGRRAYKIYVVLGILMIGHAIYMAIYGTQIPGGPWVSGIGGIVVIVWSWIDLAKLKKRGVVEPANSKSIPAHIRAWFVVPPRSAEELSEDSHEGEEEEPSLRDRMISVGTMDFQLRLLVGLAIAQIVVSVLLVALRDSLEKGQQTSFFQQLGQQGPHISTLVFITCVAFIMLGFTFVTAGAFNAQLVARAWLTAILIGLYLIFVVAGKVYGASLSIYTVSYVLYSCMAGGLLVHYYRTYGPVKQRTWLLWTGTICAGAIPAAAIWFGLPITVVETLMDIGLILIYLFVLAGTDWAEMADDASKWITHGIYERYSIWLPVAVGVLGILNLSLVVHRHGLGIFAILPGFLIFAVVLLAVLYFANFRGDWSSHMSPGVMALFVVGFLMLQDIAYAYGNIAGKDVACAVVAAGTASLLLWLSRLGRQKWLIVPVLYVFLLALITFVGVIPSVEAAITGKAVPFDPVYSDGPLTVVGISTLLLLAYLALKRAPLSKNAGALRVLATVNVAVLLLYVLSVGVYQYAQEAREKVTWAEAAVLFIALGWDVLFSGHHITNRDGRFFPRRSKVLLFFGYATLTATSVLFWTSMQNAPQLQGIIEKGSNPERFVQLGIAVLGPSLLICFLILRIGPHLFQSAAVTVPGVPELAHGAFEHGVFWKQARPAIVPLCGVLLLLWLPFQEWSEPKSGLGPSAADTAAGKTFFDEGQRFWNAGNQVAAIKPFFQAAKDGYAPAQLQIGWQYEKGIGVPQSYTEAARWYRAAAEQGQSTAMSNLGLLYELGEGVPEDWVVSARWRERSAKMGNMYGEASLGRAYQFGIGVTQNRELAIEWDQRAATQGKKDSAYFAQWLANPRNGIGFRSATEKELVTARFGSPDRVPASEPRGILFHNSTERMSWLLTQSASRPNLTERRKPAVPQRTDCCPCSPQMSDAQCFLKCNALIPRCP